VWKDERMGLRHLTDEPLHVEPELVGLPLASPTRRFVAFAIDWIVVIVPTVLVGLGIAALSLSQTDPRALRALVSARSGGGSAAGSANAFWRDIAPLLTRLEAPGMPPAARAAIEDGNPGLAADLLKDYDITLALKIWEGPETKVPPKMVVLQIEKLIPPGVRAVSLLGVPALYFVLLTRSRRGATLGKRLVGIRVVHLAGERLSMIEGLERFIGYLHIPGTAFVSLLDLWRDPNRRLPHDRVVHTAVVRRSKVKHVGPATAAEPGKGDRKSPPSETQHGVPPN
jgi:uncharacterized RDD family membrane protein YckC